MPLATIKIIAGVFDAQQKAALISKVTDAMVEVEGEAMRPLTWVIVEEVQAGDWGIGGNGVDAEAVRSIQSGAVSVRDAIGA
jgi:4-oxalocrotonate tautomerase